MAFAKLKALLRKVAEQNVDRLRMAIARLVDVFMPVQCTYYFAAAGHDADWPGNAPNFSFGEMVFLSSLGSRGGKNLQETWTMVPAPI